MLVVVCCGLVRSGVLQLISFEYFLLSSSFTFYSLISPSPVSRVYSPPRYLQWDWKYLLSTWYSVFTDYGQYFIHRSRLMSSLETPVISLKRIPKHPAHWNKGRIQRFNMYKYIQIGLVNIRNRSVFQGSSWCEPGLKNKEGERRGENC